MSNQSFGKSSLLMLFREDSSIRAFKRVSFERLSYGSRPITLIKQGS